MCCSQLHSSCYVSTEEICNCRRSVVNLQFLLYTWLLEWPCYTPGSKYSYHVIFAASAMLTELIYSYYMKSSSHTQPALWPYGNNVNNCTWPFCSFQKMFIPHQCFNNKSIQLKCISIIQRAIKKLIICAIAFQRRSNFTTLSTHT